MSEIDDLRKELQELRELLRRHNHDNIETDNISTNVNVSNATGTLAVANGGTGATTAAGALTNLGLTATAAELNILDGATLTVTELNYVDGVTSAIQTQLNAKAADADVVHDTGDETVAGVKTFSSDPIIPDEAYGAGWNASLEPPTKNAVYDKIESLSGANFAVGSVTRDLSTASGTQTIAHGLGTTPSKVKFTAFVDWTNGFSQSIGAFDGTNQSSVAILSGSSSDIHARDDTYIIYIWEQFSSEISQKATVAVDGTNITLTWTRTGVTSAVNAYILWEAE